MHEKKGREKKKQIKKRENIEYSYTHQIVHLSFLCELSPSSAVPRMPHQIPLCSCITRVLHSLCLYIPDIHDVLFSKGKLYLDQCGWTLT